MCCYFMLTLALSIQCLYNKIGVYKYIDAKMLLFLLLLRWMNGWIYGWIDGWMGEWLMDREADRCICISYNSKLFLLKIISAYLLQHASWRLISSNNYHTFIHIYKYILGIHKMLSILDNTQSHKNIWVNYPYYIMHTQWYAQNISETLCTTSTQTW